jgi:hypothetical protein
LPIGFALPDFFFPRNLGATVKNDQVHFAENLLEGGYNARYSPERLSSSIMANRVVVLPV